MSGIQNTLSSFRLVQTGLPSSNNGELGTSSESSNGSSSRRRRESSMGSLQGLSGRESSSLSSTEKNNDLVSLREEVIRTSSHSLPPLNPYPAEDKLEELLFNTESTQCSEKTDEVSLSLLSAYSSGMPAHLFEGIFEGCSANDSVLSTSNVIDAEIIVIEDDIDSTSAMPIIDKARETAHGDMEVDDQMIGSTYLSHREAPDQGTRLVLLTEKVRKEQLREKLLQKFQKQATRATDIGSTSAVSGIDKTGDKAYKAAHKDMKLDNHIRGSTRLSQRKAYVEADFPWPLTEDLDRRLSTNADLSMPSVQELIKMAASVKYDGKGLLFLAQQVVRRNKYEILETENRGELRLYTASFPNHNGDTLVEVALLLYGEDGYLTDIRTNTPINCKKIGEDRHLTKPIYRSTRPSAENRSGKIAISPIYQPIRPSTVNRSGKTAISPIYRPIRPSTVNRG